MPHDGRNHGLEPKLLQNPRQRPQTFHPTFLRLSLGKLVLLSKWADVRYRFRIEPDTFHCSSKAYPPHCGGRCPNWNGDEAPWASFKKELRGISMKIKMRSHRVVLNEIFGVHREIPCGPIFLKRFLSTPQTPPQY